MAHTVTRSPDGALHRVDIGEEARVSSPAYQAYQILHAAFVLAPIIAGIDKFLHLLANWDMYLSPAVARISPIPHTT